MEPEGSRMEPVQCLLEAFLSPPQSDGDEAVRAAYNFVRDGLERELGAPLLARFEEHPSALIQVVEHQLANSALWRDASIMGAAEVVVARDDWIPSGIVSPFGRPLGASIGGFMEDDELKLVRALGRRTPPPEN